MKNVDALLQSFRTQAPGSPRLTWYGPDGERIELSGKVLDNWVAKSANFLTEEFDVVPDSSIILELPAHWKSLVITLAALACGSTAEFVNPGTEPSAKALGNASALFVADEDRVATAVEQADVIAVALPALAMAWAGELPDGVYDFAAEVRMFADAFSRFDDPDGTQPALRSDSFTTSFDGLAALAQEYAGEQRVGFIAAAGLADIARAAVGVWLAGGSVLLFADESLANAKTLEIEQAILKF